MSIFLIARSKNTINKTVNITKMNIPTIIKADKAPVLPSSKVDARARGISATIPENIINEIPFPTPLNVICSPNHIKNVVPATNDIVVIILKEYPGSITKFPAFSKPMATPYPCKQAIKTVPYLVI